MLETMHPLLVHFPIGLLVTYSILELLSLIPRIRNNKIVRYIKLFMVAAGIASIQLALSSGEAASHAGQGVRNIIEWHEQFANISTWLYGIITILYVAKWYIQELQFTQWGLKAAQTPLHKLIAFVHRYFGSYIIFSLLAGAGIIALTVTGALGGAMVYGTNTDPVVKIVIDLLQIQH